MDSGNKDIEDSGQIGDFILFVISILSLFFPHLLFIIILFFLLSSHYNILGYMKEKKNQQQEWGQAQYRKE